MNRSKPIRFRSVRTARTLPASVAFACLVAACSEPPEKPVPALDPTKAIAGEGATEEVAPPPPEATKPARLTRINLGDLYQLVERDAALIFDVRPKTFYLLGHIPGAVSWPEGSFDRDLPKYEPRIKEAIAGNTPVVVYCTDLSCPDALNVGTRLVGLGYSVSILQGGYDAWKVAAQ